GRPPTCCRGNGAPSSGTPAISGAGLPFWIGPAPVVAGRVSPTMTRITIVATTARTRAMAIGRRDGGRRTASGVSATSGTGDELAVHQGRMNRALELVGAGLELWHV